MKGNTQIRLDYTQQDIESELIELKVDYINGITEMGTNYTAYININSEVIHYYENNKCVLGIIIPNTLIEALKMKNEYNDKYVKLSDTSWMIDSKITVLMDKYKVIGTISIFYFILPFVFMLPFINITAYNYRDVSEITNIESPTVLNISFIFINWFSFYFKVLTFSLPGAPLFIKIFLSKNLVA